MSSASRYRASCAATLMAVRELPDPSTPTTTAFCCDVLFVMSFSSEQCWRCWGAAAPPFCELHPLGIGNVLDCPSYGRSNSQAQGAPWAGAEIRGTGPLGVA